MLANKYTLYAKVKIQQHVLADCNIMLTHGFS